ncbi:MAG: hypothetical protein PVH59_05990 [Anaerolineae bacterium]
MSRFRRNLILAGIAGLFASACLVGISSRLVTSGLVKPPFPHSLVELLLAIVLGAFSVAEIPIMLFAMRRLLVGPSTNESIATWLNGLYVCFAAIYGVPVTLLTGNAEYALALSALSIVRFASSLAFVRESAL